MVPANSEQVLFPILSVGKGASELEGLGLGRWFLLSPLPPLLPESPEVVLLRFPTTSRLLGVARGLRSGIVGCLSVLLETFSCRPQKPTPWFLSLLLFLSLCCYSSPAP